MSVCLRSSLSGGDVRRANQKHMKPPGLCQLLMYPHACACAHDSDTQAHSRKPNIPFSAIAPSALHSSLSSVSLSSSRTHWTELDLNCFFFFEELFCALCYDDDITPLPHGEIYTYTGYRQTPEVYHTAQQRLRVHLRQSHIQANKAFLCAAPREILWENTEYYCGGGWQSECQHGIRSIQLTGIIITLGFLGKTTGRNHKRLDFLHQTDIQFISIHPAERGRPLSP